MSADQTIPGLTAAFLPARSALTGKKVHLWRASLSQAEQLRRELSALLTPDEHERAARFYFDRDRERYITGRGFLRLLLGAYLQTDPARIRLAYSAYGRPALAASHRADLAFNLAHSEDKVLYALALGRRIGIDLEWVRPMPDEGHFAALYYSERETRILNLAPAPERTAVFFKLWTSKEAYLKAVGAGLTGELNQVEAEFLPGGKARFLSLANDPTRARDWQLELFTPWEGFQAALAVEAASDLAVDTFAI